MMGLPLLAAAVLGVFQGAEPSHEMEDGVLALEIESAPPAGKWAGETALAGFSGASYYTWKGPDLSGPAEKAALTFRFRVLAPGRYHLRLHNRHDHPDATLENDCYTRLDDGPWVKTFSSVRGQWTWNTNHEFADGRKIPAEYALDSGVHALQITGRSVNFSIDRVHVYRDGVQGAENVSRPPTPTTAHQRAGPGPYVKLASLAARVHTGRGLGDALKALREKSLSSDPDEAREAKAMIESLERWGRRGLDAALALKESAPLSAVAGLERLAAQFAGDEVGARADGEAQSLKRDPEFQKELKAEAAWKRIEEMKGRLQPQNGARDYKSEGFRRRNQAALAGLAASCQSLIKNCPGTKAAARAEEFLRVLGP